MWLFTTFGFYSIHTSPKGDDYLEVRARAPEDLDALRDYCTGLGPTVCTPDHDYQYRAQIVRDALARVVSSMVRGINYSNFKDSVQGDERRHDAYMQVWAALRHGLSAPAVQIKRLVKSRTNKNEINGLTGGGSK